MSYLLIINAYNFKHSDHACNTHKPASFFNLRLTFLQNILKSIVRNTEDFQCSLIKHSKELVALFKDKYVERSA